MVTLHLEAPLAPLLSITLMVTHALMQQTGNVVLIAQLPDAAGLGLLARITIHQALHADASRVLVLSNDVLK